MDDSPLTTNGKFDRFQQLLLAMRAGDELRAADAVRVTGLREATCRRVLDGLILAGLMTHEPDDRYVRHTLTKVTLDRRS